jgi:hypothetical protein
MQGKMRSLTEILPVSSESMDTGAITNHVNIVRNAKGQFAYVTVGGENVVKVYTTTDSPQLVATIRRANCRMVSGHLAMARVSMLPWRMEPGCR